MPAETRLERMPEQWAMVRPEALRGGSNAQAVNVLTMALHDIAVLAEAVSRTERNRDMWKGQCERQAEQLREAMADGCIHLTRVV